MDVLKVSRTIQSLAGVFLTTGVLIALLYFADTESLRAVRDADLRFLVLAVIFANIPLLIYSFIWREVLEMAGIHLSYGRTFQVVLSNAFVNNITPFGNIGGEVAVTYILSKLTGEKSGKIFSAVFASSLINFSPIATLLIVGFTVTGYWTLIAGTVFLLFLLFSITVFRRQKSVPFSIGLPFPEKMKEFLNDFRKALKMFSGSKRKISGLVFLAHTWLVFDLLSIIFVGYAYGLDLLNPLLLLVVPMARVANYTPTPGGSGPYEIVFSGLLSQFLSVSFAEGVLVAVTYRAITYYIGLLAGYFALNSLHFLNRSSIFIES